jgi:hypothetical protein
MYREETSHARRHHGQLQTFVQITAKLGKTICGPFLKHAVHSSTTIIGGSEQIPEEVGRLHFTQRSHDRDKVSMIEEA